MLQFQVPQFIEREAKVVGFLTMRQAIYIGIPLIISFFLWFLLPRLFFFIGLISLEAAGIALAFVKVGGKPIPILIWNAITFVIGAKTFVWQKGNYRGSIQQGEMLFGATSSNKEKSVEDEISGSASIQMKGGSKLQNLTTQVETKKY